MKKENKHFQFIIHKEINVIVTVLRKIALRNLRNEALNGEDAELYSIAEHTLVEN